MNIFVCIKQALDWNASTKDFRIDSKTQEVSLSFARYRIDQFDEIALEIGLRCRDKLGGELRAITVGSEDADDVLRHAFALKANKASHIKYEGQDGAAAVLLAAAVQHYNGGIVLCGRTSSVSGSGQTGPAIAEILGIPFIANVVQIEGVEGEWLCRCETAFGYEVLKVTKPFVATITNADTNLPRAPSMKDVMLAQRAKIEMLTADSLSVANSSCVSHTRVLRRYIPSTSRSCQRIEGSPQLQAKAIANYIKTMPSQA
jgi:electron transfer flavoprotein beta subunit